MQYKFVTLEKKKNPEKNRKTLKRLLSVFLILLCLLTGIGLLLRGYFLGNPLFFNNTDLQILNPLLNPNNIANLEGFKGQPNYGAGKLFGDSIKTIFPPQFKNSKAWLKVTSTKDLMVGYLDSSGNFVQAYTVPVNATIVHLYDDESISYVLNPENGSQAKLLGLDTKEVQYQIGELKLGEYFTSTWFNPTEKGFYVTIIDSVGFFSINFINQKSEITKIFTTTALGKEAYIINSSATSIDIKEGAVCYSILLQNKSLKNINCPEIQTNSTPIETLDVAVNPEGQIQSSFIFNSSNYAIVKDSLEVYKLLKYADSLVPSSYPLDYWTEVNLKIEDIKSVNLI